MNPIDRILAVRADALACGDFGVVRECEWQLQRYGYVEAAISDTFEVAVPAAPRRGRPPKPRT